MSQFDFMGFGYDGANDDMFVAHAQKYSKGQMVELCTKEYGYVLTQKHLRQPTVDDIREGYCAFRFGVHEYPDGCYSLVDKTSNGSFPVLIIDYETLKER